MDSSAQNLFHKDKKDDAALYDFPNKKQQQQRKKPAALQEMAEDIRKAFDSNGFVVLRDYFWDDKESKKEAAVNSGSITSKTVNAAILLDEWYSLAQDIFRSIFKDLCRYGHTSFPLHCRQQPQAEGEQVPIEYVMTGLGVKHGFREVVMRSPGRYEISLLHPLEGQEDDVQSKIDLLRDYVMHKCPLLSSLVPLLLHVAKGKNSENNVHGDEVGDDDDDYYLSNMSLVVSTPGSPAQAWHADGGHLSLQQHLPCHCLNVFIPLHDITTTLGPTELRPGTHVYTRNLAPLLLAAHCKKQLKAPVAPLLKRGDVLLFDYRILHRGLANQEQHEREQNELEQSSSNPSCTGSNNRHDSATTNSTSSHDKNDNDTKQLLAMPGVTSKTRTTIVRDKNRYILVFTIAKKGFKDVLNFPSQSIYDNKTENKTTN